MNRLILYSLAMVLFVGHASAQITGAKGRQVAKKTQKVPVKKPAKSALKVVPDNVSVPTPDAPFMLKGFLPDFPDSMMASLQSPTDQNFRGPRVRVSNKQFLMTGELPQPGIYKLVLQNPKNQADSRYVDLFLNNEPTAIRFSGNNGMFDVLEGPSLQAFAGLINTFSAEFDTLSRLAQMRQSAGTMNFSPDSINTAWNNVSNEVTLKVPGFLEQHGKTPVAPFLLCTLWPLTSGNVEMVEGWLTKIDSSALQNDFGVLIRENVTVEKLFGYGRVAPPFMQNDTTGKPVELQDFRGKYLLVDFWASWCGPCRQENPAVVSAYNLYKNKNFSVIGVSLDRDKAAWIRAINDDNLTWTQVSDLKFWQNSVAKLYRIQSIPQNFLLDPEGKIIGKNLRGAALFEALGKIFN